MSSRRIKLILVASRQHAIEASHQSRPDDVTLLTPELIWIHDSGGVLDETRFVYGDDEHLMAVLAGLSFAEVEYRGVKPSEQMHNWLLGRTQRAAS